MSSFSSVLFLSYLPALYFYLASGAPPFIQFRLSTADPNHLTLECYSGMTGVLDGGATFELFYTPTDNASPHGNVVPSAEEGAIYDVTPQEEAFIRCTSEGGMQSGFVAIAAVPTFVMGSVQTVNVFNNADAVLECPIPLGRLFDHLEPYRFRWVMFDSRNFAVPVETRLYSNNNRSLTVFINETTRSNRYQCILELKRCDIITSNVPFCQSLPYGGPLMPLDIYETSRIITRPEPQQVSADEVAIFTCTGVGSFINISWEYDDVCSPADCGSAVVTSHNETGDDRNRRIISVLMINTSMLELSSTGGDYSATIQCTQHQNVPPMINLQGRDQTFSAKLEVTGVPVPQPPSNTVDSNGPPTTDQPAATTELGSSDMVTDPVNRIWIIAVTVIIGALILTIIITVILVLACRKMQKKKEKGRYSVASDLPDELPTTTRHKPNRVYEELDGRYFVGTEKVCMPFQRQNGIEFDPSNPKADNFSIRGSDDQGSKSGGGCSDVSGLSGVSGNTPGAHKMPTYHEPSVVSGADSFLAPPQLWDRRYSGGSRGTQSTIVPPLHPPEQYYHHSATEVGCGCSCSHQMPTRCASHEGVNVRESALVFREKHYPQQQCDLPPFPYASHMSRTSSCSKGSDHSSSQFSHRFISDATLLTVVNCLMHNKDCEIPDCPCNQLQDRYRHLEASKVPLQQKKSPERKRKKHYKLPISSSTESDSDVPNNDRSSRRANMHLKLCDEKKLHPHYHISTESYRMGRTRSRASRRRSRSLSDLTPITEIGETPTPLMGGAIKAGTPIHCDRTLVDAGSIKETDLFQQAKQELLQHTALLTPLSKSPLLLREISLSSDNLPVLCLNNCPLQLKTPSPLKGKGHNLVKRNSNKPALESLQENSNSTETDDSNTSSRSCSEAEMEATKSDYDEGIQMSLGSQNGPLNHSSFHPGESSGYESEAYTASMANSSLHGPGLVKGHASPSSRCSRSPFESRSTVSVGNSLKGQVSDLRRSSSPFETETTVSCDGAIIKTTEC